MLRICSISVCENFHKVSLSHVNFVVVPHSIIIDMAVSIQFFESPLHQIYSKFSILPFPVTARNFPLFGRDARNFQHLRKHAALRLGYAALPVLIYDIVENPNKLKEFCLFLSPAQRTGQHILLPCTKP